MSTRKIRSRQTKRGKLPRGDEDPGHAKHRRRHTRDRHNNKGRTTATKKIKIKVGKTASRRQ